MLFSNDLELERCPHCGVSNPGMPVKYHLTTTGTNGVSRLWKFYACTRCGGTVCASAKADGSDVEKLPVLDHFPKTYSINKAIKGRAFDYLQQAMQCLHAPSGAILLASSSVDAMLKHHKYTEGSFHDRIEEAAKDHLITEDMKDWAHTVRLEGNIERHADNTAPLPTEEDAKRTLDFALALGEYLYVLPERVKLGRKK